jgi:uncharacterized protein (TIGR02118 family)
MVSYFVRYTGVSPNGDAFADYYEQKHAPILRDLTGIRALIMHRPIPWRDPYEVKQGGSFLLAQMVFDDPKQLDLALQSGARARAREDFAKFPAFQGDVTHEALSAKVIF